MRASSRLISGSSGADSRKAKVLRPRQSAGWRPRLGEGESYWRAPRFITLARRNASTALDGITADGALSAAYHSAASRRIVALLFSAMARVTKNADDRQNDEQTELDNFLMDKCDRSSTPPSRREEVGTPGIESQYGLSQEFSMITLSSNQLS